MLNVLVDHAIDNVWCTPEQDNQVILKLARLTPVGGVFNRYKLHWDYIPLPEKNINYHVFQIGQIHPLLLNLLEKREEWVSLAQACNGKNTILDIYTNT